MKKIFLFLILLSNIVITAEAKKEEAVIAYNESFFNVVFDKEKPINFIGKKSLDTVNGQTGNMVYPGDTAGLFLVSILTHAAVNSGVQSRALSKEQEAANQVLIPFQPFIDRITPQFLWNLESIDSGLKNSAQFFLADGHSEESKWEIKITPLFALTQSKKSLLIHNNVEFIDKSMILKSKKKSATTSKNKKGKKEDSAGIKIVIVSDPTTAEDIEKYWSDNDGKLFLDTAKKMFMDSFGLALKKHTEDFSYSTSDQATIKYLEENTKKIERGYIIEQNCKRILFHSLSGELKSVPTLDFYECDKNTANQPAQGTQNTQG